MPKDAPLSTATRAERTLAYVIVSTIGLSIVAIFAVLIGAAMGATANHGFEQGLWPTIRILPSIGLPLGFALIVVVFVLGAVRRGRAAKGASN